MKNYLPSHVSLIVKLNFNKHVLFHKFMFEQLQLAHDI
jgi:hypothetical protein